jgi:hypothetical protein
MTKGASKMRPVKSKRAREAKQSSLKDFLIRDDSPVRQILRRFSEQSPEPHLDADEARKLLDEEMGDRTLTEELYKMRHEESF